MKPGALIGPLLLIGVGVLFLLNNMGLDLPLSYMFQTFWPVILIVVGLAQIAGAITGRRGSVAGGAFITILGCLFLVQQVWNVSFRHTWPILLITAGTIGLLRAMLGSATWSGRGTGRFMRGGLPR